jgi:alpha-beta hydrolase superfamily lysophospholipase
MELPPLDFERKTSDGLVLRGRNWPVNSPKAIVCLMHGLGEHCGRYGHLAVAFNLEGMAFMGIDQRGHGRSEGQRGHTPSYDRLLEAIDLLLVEAGQHYPGVPIVLYGHSFGGSQVLNYVLRRNTPLAAVVASSPWLRLTVKRAGILALIDKVCHYLLPGAASHSRVEASLVSHDPEVVEAYSRDPLIHDRITARCLMVCVRAGRYALHHAGELRVPALLMHGTDDPITDPSASRLFAERAGDMATFRPWPGMLHEVHNEVGREEVLEFVVGWVQKHAGT